MLAAILEAVVNKTPAVMKLNDADYRSLKDFDIIVPRSSQQTQYLHDTSQVTVTMGTSTWAMLNKYSSTGAYVEWRLLGRYGYVIDTDWI
jgi:hypothetical protein